MDPIATGAVIKAAQAGQKMADSAAAETGGLLRRLLGPSADVIGQDWADRLRQHNLDRLLHKTEKHAEGNSDPGWIQPRVANAVFEAAQYANDEVVTDYLSGVLASARAPEGGNDDALPWSSLVARLSSLQLRMHYVAYLNFRQVLRATAERSRLFEFDSTRIAFPIQDYLAAIGLDPEGSDFPRFADALAGLHKEGLIEHFAHGDRDFFTKHESKHRWNMESPIAAKRVLETPYDDALLLGCSATGIQFFMWGIGRGMTRDTEYLDPANQLQIRDPDVLIDSEPLDGVGFWNSFWVEYDADGNKIEKDSETSPS